MGLLEGIGWCRLFLSNREWWISSTWIDSMNSIYLDSDTTWNYNLLTCLGEWNFDQGRVYFQLASKLYCFNMYMICSHTKDAEGHLISLRTSNYYVFILICLGTYRSCLFVHCSKKMTLSFTFFAGVSQIKVATYKTLNRTHSTLIQWILTWNADFPIIFQDNNW